ncbi:MAG TPA: DUF4244 domain-containing protein [Yinghuangia sp.]|uniref:DUF4244 domain-containing protein n=1 Tax=Yinghuangia sp. YIM S10712 TaxID=3436930 RepID=UPI002D1359D5|nr:DUF4244 domain-containing protein [Yinghuangia sp.]
MSEKTVAVSGIAEPVATRAAVSAKTWRALRRLRTRSAALARRLARTVRRDDGMSTAEYAVGTVAAVGFGAVLYKVVSSDAVFDGLSAIITKALNATF